MPPTKHKNQQTRTNITPPPFTRLAFLLGLITIEVMQYIYWTHRNIPEDTAWVAYALYMTLFAAAGLFGTQAIYNQPLFPTDPQDFVPLSLDTGVKAALILAASMITQLIANAALSFTTQEQALYFVFAAVAEELFFRVLLLSLLLKIKADLQMKIIAIFLQATAFAAIHQNYYADLPMLISVFVGGIILGIFYVYWKDPTANILGHFCLNLFAVRNLFFTLGAIGPTLLTLIILGSVGILFSILYRKNQQFKSE
jgi:membrane protease YdiL (CAAX protease family)